MIITTIQRDVEEVSLWALSKTYISFRELFAKNSLMYANLKEGRFLV
jgi:hypothetical protein